jgi:hypothetical protein
MHAAVCVTTPRMYNPHNARICTRSPSNFMHMYCPFRQHCYVRTCVVQLQCNCTVQSCACICASWNSSWLRRLMPRYVTNNLEGWRRYNALIRSRLCTVEHYHRPFLFHSLILRPHVLYPHTFRGHGSYPWLSEYLVLVNTLHIDAITARHFVPLAWATMFTLLRVPQVSSSSGLLPNSVSLLPTIPSRVSRTRRAPYVPTHKPRHSSHISRHLHHPRTCFKQPASGDGSPCPDHRSLPAHFPPDACCIFAARTRSYPTGH